MKLTAIKNGFLGINEGISFETSYSKAKVVVIPFGMEKTVSYGKGTKNGPKAIIKASHQLEPLDDEAVKPFFKSGIATIKEPAVPKDPKKAITLLAQMVSQVLKDKKFPIVLGGEHSLTQGTAAGFAKHFKNFTLLHFDAHTDTRENYRGSVYSHGSVMAQVLKKIPITKLVQIGIRSIGDKKRDLIFQKAYAKKNKIFWGWQKINPAEVVKAIPTKNVLISFDVDVFDPAVMPSTGTPEPGGLLWWPALDILKAVFKSKNVIGADVVELAPIKGLHHTDFTIARLVYKMIGYKFF